ncbi:Sugar transport protein 7, partial [Glycine soja]
CKARNHSVFRSGRQKIPRKEGKRVFSLVFLDLSSPRLASAWFGPPNDFKVKKPARLGKLMTSGLSLSSPRQAAIAPSDPFPINMHAREAEKGFESLEVEGIERTKKEEEERRGNEAEVLPNRDRDHSLYCFLVLYSSFDRRILQGYWKSQKPVVAWELDVGTGGVTSMDDFLIEFFPSIYRQKKHAHENNYCKYDNQGLAAFTSSLYIVGLVASLMASPVTRKYGRRASIIGGGISFLIGSALNASAINLIMLILGQVMLGVGIGFGNQAIPLYLSKMAPTHLRGGLNMMFQVATTFGIFTANMINFGTQKIKPWCWRLSLGLAAVPVLLMTMGGIFLPNTPNSLIERGLMEKGGSC